MRLGFVSAILPDLSLEEVMRFASAEGFDSVELMCWPLGKAERRYAGVTHLDVSNMRAAEAREASLMAADCGVRISGLGYYPNVLSPDPAEAEVCRAHLRKVIEAAAHVGVGIVNTFIGRDWTRSVDANWPEMLGVWRELTAFAGDLGVRIGIENCPMLFTDDEWPGGKNLATSPAIWRRLFADIGADNLGLNFDPSHFVWQQMDYLAAIREFAGRIFHVHAKDARVDRHRLAEVGIMATPLEYHSPKLPGLGDVNWGAFFSTLSDVGYTGDVCIEVEDRAYEATLETRQAALRQSARYLRQFMGE